MQRKGGKLSDVGARARDEAANVPSTVTAGGGGSGSIGGGGAPPPKKPRGTLIDI